MKTVLITGTSSGIGKATALLFQENGWNVAATMRAPEATMDLATSGNLKRYKLDVTDPESIEKTIASVISDFGGIDVVVNNAGIYTTNPLELTREEELREIVNTNILGTVNVIKGILPYYRKRKCGTIINISSIAGRATFPYQAIYHGTKWAIEGISEGLQYELRNLNVTVKIVEPGMVKTNLYERVKSFSTANYPQEYSASFSSWHRYLLFNFEKGYAPGVDARTIYRAATDGKAKLRYVSDNSTKFVFLLRAILPLPLFSSAIRTITGIQNRVSGASV